MKLNKFLAVIFGFSVVCSTALAQSSTHPQSVGGSLMQMLPMFILIIAVFYFLLIRPQSKRSKEHKQLMSNLSVGDEVVTTAGIVGKIEKLTDNFIIITTGDHVAMYFQKNSISTILPKGTMDSIK